jgi:hypothetical protein
VLASDLEWPPYLAILKLAALRYGKVLRVLPIRQNVLGAECDRQELIRLLVAEYFSYGCDGLFLSDITHTGVRVPYMQVLRHIRDVRSPGFTVIDGAQAFGQRPVSLLSGNADLYLAGTQKWFGAYHPLRLAFVAPQAAWAVTLFDRLMIRRQLFDPLSELCRAMACGLWSPYGETVNLSALITAAGALSDWMQSPDALIARWNRRRMNRRRVLSELAPFASAAIDASLSAGIALLKLKGASYSPPPSRTSLRAALGREYVVASEPLRGMIRLAMPGVRLSQVELFRLGLAFGRVTDSLARQPIESMPLPLSRH